MLQQTIVTSVLAVHGLSRGADIINLEDHLHQLGGQKDLLLLAVKGLNHMLSFHVCKNMKSLVFSTAIHYQYQGFPMEQITNLTVTFCKYASLVCILLKNLL